MIKVHPNKRYLMRSNGEPFLYLADTAWTALQKLDREEIVYYLNRRAQQEFNVIQVCALSEDDGLRRPNVYAQLPFESCDPTKPNEPYWLHLDYLIRTAHERGLAVALLPTWGDKFNKEAHGAGPEIFNPNNAFLYGKWLAERYRDNPNILWVLGGDRALKNERHALVIDRMAEGISASGARHPVTFHPCGAASSIDFVKGRKYIDFHSIQSGHGLECYKSWQIIRETMEQENKPCLDMECRYEDFPACFDPSCGHCWDEDDIRQNVYWNMMEGVCGHAYGHRSVWCFCNEKSNEYPYTWREALDRPAAGQMKYAKTLRLSRPYFEFRRAMELVVNKQTGMAHIAAGRGDGYAFIYTPLGMPIQTDLTGMPDGHIRAAWFNPRNGSSRTFAVISRGQEWFQPPTSGKGNDWVLVLDVNPNKIT